LGLGDPRIFCRSLRDCRPRPAYGNPTFVEGNDSSPRPVLSGTRVDSDDSPFERRALGTRCRADGLGQI